MRFILGTLEVDVTAEHLLLAAVGQSGQSRAKLSEEGKAVLGIGILNVQLAVGGICNNRDVGRGNEK